MQKIKKSDFMKDAKFIAKDKDGVCYVYDDEPEMYEKGWDNPGGIASAIIDDWLVPQEVIMTNWKDSLFEIVFRY